MKIIIKGTLSEAKSAANARGIILLHPRPLNAPGEILAEVLDRNHSKVIDWFVETDGVQAPFPVGSCLWFSVPQTDSLE